MFLLHSDPWKLALKTLKEISIKAMWSLVAAGGIGARFRRGEPPAARFEVWGGMWGASATTAS